ncbi:MAG: hypothetical protein KCHDKBKB_02710 [Elusimicrobia bacterium]|nr:hypothetical protein [Elusimicrobiota bacterium]
MAIEEKPKEEEKAEETTEESTEVAQVKEGDIEIKQDWTEIPSLQLVQFDYDSASLSDSARAALKTNVAIIKKLPKSVVVRVEGHCDDRGTVEYNIALGQRRANAVRGYYSTAGLAKNRLETISFGEERPLCNEMTDACWSRNRRSATKVKNAEPITVNTNDL